MHSIRLYFYDVLEVKHLAVINVNDAYGNAFVDGIRAAAKVYAPDLETQQIWIIDDETIIEAAIQTLVRTEYRYVFGLVFGVDFHNAIMTEAYRQGLAGNGLHNWFFGDAFGGLNGRAFVKDSP